MIVHALKHIMTRLRAFLANYSANRRGAIAIYAGFAVPAVLAAVGIAIDLSRVQLEEQRMASALDAAGLAAASSEELSQSEREARMRKFFNRNYSGESGGADDIDVTMSTSGPNDRDITLTASTDVQTTLMAIFGYDTVPIEVTSIVSKKISGLEVALVLDVTGSMAGQDIADLRVAADDFVSIAFDNIDNPENVRISLVPYAATVNVGSIAPNITPSNPVEADSSKYYDPEITGDPGANDDTQWLGCVDARSYPDDTLDTTPSSGGLWDAYWWQATPGDEDDNPWESEGLYGRDDHTICNNRRTPNLGCPERNPVMPLSSDEAKLQSAIDELVYWCRGGTLGNLGMSWGWRTLSAKPPFEQGSPYNDSKWSKAVVMMTDGNNQLWRKPGIEEESDFSAYGRVPNALGNDRWDGKTEAENRMRETCNAMEANDIIIYTITFNVGDTGTQDLYRDCASEDGRYINTGSGSELIQAFNDIAIELSDLYLAD